MQKVVPQPVCSNGGQNLAAGEGDPDQVQGQGGPRVREESGGDCGAPGMPCNVCLSQQDGAQIPEPCGIGDPGKTKRQDGFPGRGASKGLLGWA